MNVCCCGAAFSNIVDIQFHQIDCWKFHNENRNNNNTKTSDDKEYRSDKHESSSTSTDDYVDEPEETAEHYVENMIAEDSKLILEDETTSIGEDQSFLEVSLNVEDSLLDNSLRSPSRTSTSSEDCTEDSLLYDSFCRSSLLATIERGKSSEDCSTFCSTPTRNIIPQTSEKSNESLPAPERSEPSEDCKELLETLYVVFGETNEDYGKLLQTYYTIFEEKKSAEKIVKENERTMEEKEETLLRQAGEVRMLIDERNLLLKVVERIQSDLEKAYKKIKVLSEDRTSKPGGGKY